MIKHIDYLIEYDWHRLLGLCEGHLILAYRRTGGLLKCNTLSRRAITRPECIECLSQSLEKLHAKKSKS